MACSGILPSVPGSKPALSAQFLQELAVPQVPADPGDPRPVLHRRGHPVRRLPAGYRPAAVPAGDDLMLGDLRPDRRHVDHLPPLDPGLFRAGQARGAAARLVPDHAIGPISQLQGLPSAPPADQACGRSSYAATSAPACPARPRTAAGMSSSNWPALAPSARRPALAGRYQRAQLRDLRVPFSQQLPQSAVSGTQRRRLTGRMGRIGHMRT
jgi:hypothetical protein